MTCMETGEDATHCGVSEERVSPVCVQPSDSRFCSACTMEASKIQLPLQGRRNSNALHSSSHLAVLPTL